MFGGIGGTEIFILLVILVIIFGAGRLPEIGGALGKSLRGFKKATQEPEEPDGDAAQQEKTKEDERPG